MWEAGNVLEKEGDRAVSRKGETARHEVESIEFYALGQHRTIRNRSKREQEGTQIGRCSVDKMPYKHEDLNLIFSFLREKLGAESTYIPNGKEEDIDKSFGFVEQPVYSNWGAPGSTESLLQNV